MGLASLLLSVKHLLKENVLPEEKKISFFLGNIVGKATAMRSGKSVKKIISSIVVENWAALQNERCPAPRAFFPLGKRIPFRVDQLFQYRYVCSLILYMK